MKKTFTFISLFLVLNMFSQEGKIFFETNFNTFSQSSLKDFQQEFKVDLHPIPIKTVDDFPANIGFTAGYEITESNIALFLSYNSTGGKLSYSDYSGSVKIEESLNAITFGGIYYIDLNKERKDLRIGLRGFSMYSNLDLDSYSKISNNIQQENLGLTSIDFGFGGQLDYEYPLSFLILKATVGFDIVIGGKLIFKNNNENYLINNSNKKVTTGWSGFRTGIGIVIPIN